MWTFSSPDGPTELEVLHVPAGRPVRLLITSRDVVHSFFVPGLRLKRDALPGRYTEAWFEATQPGVHQVLCAEFCGLDHSVMRAEVVVMEPDAFEAWRAGRPSQNVASTLPERGQAVAAEVGCLRCHTLDGTLHLAPSFRGLYGKRELLMDGSHVLVDEQYLTESMMEPTAKVVAGFAPIMPSYFAQLSPGQVAALLELIRSLRAENPGPATGGAP
jgi:cytochrome c oxidase subunit 2